MDISSDEGWCSLLDTGGNDAIKPDLLPRTETDNASESPQDHLRRAFSVDDWAVRDALASATATATSQGTGFSADEAILITSQTIREVLPSQQNQRAAAVQAVLSDFLRKHFIEPHDGCVVSKCPGPRALQEAASQLMVGLRCSSPWEGKQTWYYHALMEPIKNLTRELDGGAPDTSTLLSGELSPEPTCVTTVPAPVPASVPHPRCQPRPSYRCEVPSCHNPTFKRAADLARHNVCIHPCEEEKPKLFCDYRKCHRHETPFYRIDHFRDHLRDLHKEDLFRRGCRHDEQWWNSRSSHAIFKGWWRCCRCLVPRVDIQAYGFVCPTCGNPCEIERQEYRQRKEALGGEEEEEGFDLGLNFEGGYY